MEGPTQVEDFNVSQKLVDESITQEVYMQTGFKTSICLLILNTGFEAIGTYAPISVEDVDITIGKEKARAKAIEAAEDHLKSINQWRKAVSDAQRGAMEDQQRRAEMENQANTPANKPKGKGKKLKV